MILHTVFLLLYVPMLCISSGIFAVSILWLILQFCFCAVYIYQMHTKLLPGEMKKWCIEDVGFPFIGAALAAFICRSLCSSPGILLLSGVFGAIFLSTALMTRSVRTAIKTLRATHG